MKQELQEAENDIKSLTNTISLDDEDEYFKEEERLNAEKRRLILKIRGLKSRIEIQKKANSAEESRLTEVIDKEKKNQEEFKKKKEKHEKELQEYIHKIEKIYKTPDDLEVLSYNLGKPPVNPGSAQVLELFKLDHRRKKLESNLNNITKRKRKLAKKNKQLDEKLETDVAKLKSLYEMEEIEKYLSEELFNDDEEDVVFEYANSSDEDMPIVQQEADGTVVIEPVWSYINRLRAKSLKGDVQLQANVSNLRTNITNLKLLIVSQSENYARETKELKKKYDSITNELITKQTQFETMIEELSNFGKVQKKAKKTILEKDSLTLKITETEEKYNKALLELEDFKKSVKDLPTEKDLAELTGKLASVTLKERRAVSNLESAFAEIRKLKEEKQPVIMQDEKLINELEAQIINYETEMITKGMKINKLEKELESTEIKLKTFENERISFRNQVNVEKMKHAEELDRIKIEIVKPLKDINADQAKRNALLLFNVAKLEREQSDLIRKGEILKKYNEGEIEMLTSKLEDSEKKVAKRLTEIKHMSTQTIETDGTPQNMKDLKRIRDLLTRDLQDVDRNVDIVSKSPQPTDIKVKMIASLKQDRIDLLKELDINRQYISTTLHRSTKITNEMLHTQLNTLLHLEKSYEDIETQKRRISEREQDVKLQEDSINKQRMSITSKEILDESNSFLVSLAHKFLSYPDNCFNTKVTRFFSYNINEWVGSFEKTFKCTRFLYADIKKLDVEQSKALFTILVNINMKTGSKSHLWYGNELNRMFNHTDYHGAKTLLLKLERANKTYLNWLDQDAVAIYPQLGNLNLNEGVIAYSSLLRTIGNVSVTRNFSATEFVVTNMKLVNG
jgi:hypothetical protein